MRSKAVRLAWSLCLTIGLIVAGCGGDDSGPGDASDVRPDAEVPPDVPGDADVPEPDGDVPADAPIDAPADGDDAPADGADDGSDAATVWPLAAGAYLLVADFEPLDLLPDQVQRLVDDVGEILQSPGAPLLRLLAVTACELDSECTDYSAHSYLDYIFDPPASAGADSTLNVYGVVVATILESNLLTGVRAVRSDPGATLEEVLDPGRNVFDDAEGWRLDGTLELAADPDASGGLGAANAIACNRVTWRWTGAEAAFVLRPASLVTAGGIQADLVPYPPAAPDGTRAIAMAPFDLGLDWAGLLVRVLESVVFPRTIDPSVDSFEQLFTVAIDCEAFGDDLAARGGTYEMLAPLLETACTALAVSAGPYLEAWIDERTSGVHGSFRLGSPTDGPCPAAEVAGPTGPVIERFGEDRDGARCPWEGTTRFGEDDGEALAVEWAATAT
ncbi:MAG: hypothetical protein JXB32_10125 [Deltaproteobacteria bacterium]|nr:hypothetical protein [Deltaproteobacteria bacterium]